MKMIERVARAIADANMEDYEELKELHDALAIAAVNALRDPSYNMLSAGWPYSPNINEAWEAMLDAAIENG